MFVPVVPAHRRERSKVPYIVRQCIEEVEKRGIDEVGIYRISGVATDIQALKTAFDASKTPISLSLSSPFITSASDVGLSRDEIPPAVTRLQ